MASWSSDLTNPRPTAEAAAAHELAERRFEQPLISAFLDLDPARFATGGTRTTEVNSLLDQAQQRLQAKPLEPAERTALEQDIRRVGSYLTAELDPSGIHGVAVYCSGRESLFQAIRLPHPVHTEIVIEPIPKLEPLLPPPEPTCVCVALVNRRDARFFLPTGGRFREHPFDDEGIEHDVDTHLRRSAARLHELWRSQSFDRLVLGGPHELVTRFTLQLSPDLRGVLDEAEIGLDVNTSSAAQLEEALEPLRQRWRQLAQWEALQRLLSTLTVRDGTAVGLADTLAALDQRQIEALVLAPRADAEGGECPQCGQLYAAGHGSLCPIDGTELRRLRSLRSAMVRNAVLQGADVIVLEDFAGRPEISAFQGIGAILRH